MRYCIKNTVTGKILDKNTYYIDSFGCIWKRSSPIPIKLKEHEVRNLKVILERDITYAEEMIKDGIFNET